MSWCRNGGRDWYAKSDEKAYDQSEPIRARVVFTDGTFYAFSCSKAMRHGTRELSHFEADGAVYTRAEPVMLDARPTMVTVEMGDGTERHYPLALGEGERVEGVTVDGERFCRAETGTEPPENETGAQGASERAQNRNGGEPWTA